MGRRPELVFPLNSQHNHAPGVAELSDGSLFVSWYRGSGERSADDVHRALMIGAFGAFLVAQRAVPAMLGKGRGAILFTGASASVKGYAESAPFAMAKFALRGLAQSMARELSPKGIHVAHFVIDGAIRAPGRADPNDSTLDPDAIAQTYMNVLMQPRSAWTWEVEVRPWVERF